MVVLFSITSATAGEDVGWEMEKKSSVVLVRGLMGVDTAKIADVVVPVMLVVEGGLSRAGEIISIAESGSM